jgi:hypothetical protein
MEVNQFYNKVKDGKKYFVYQGSCDSRPTKWITRSKWDGKISLRFDSKIGELVYSDSKNKPILVFENDEPGWSNW